MNANQNAITQSIDFRKRYMVLDSAMLVSIGGLTDSSKLSA